MQMESALLLFFLVPLCFWLLFKIKGASTYQTSFYQNTIDALNKNMEELSETNLQLVKENATLTALNQEAQSYKEKFETLQKQSLQQNEQFVTLQAKMEILEQQLKLEHEHKELLKTESEQLKEHFKFTAEQILKEKTAEFTEQNQKNISQILSPLKDNLESFKKQVESTYEKESKDRVSLSEQIIHLRQLNEKITEEASNLTKALKGDNKLQGNWGEMILEKVLEYSGLQKNREYSTQSSFRNEEGKLLRPDVLIHLPEGKDIVIDSKVSLSAFEKYFNSPNEKEKNIHLKAHLQSLQNHIKGLTEKHYYTRSTDTIDFVLLFIPIESAYLCAVESNPDIFLDAFNKKIIAVTPSTLLTSLKTIEHLWRMDKQNKNAQNIVSKAGSIYDKLRGFVEDMEKLGKQLDTCHNSYNAAYAKLTTGRGNLIKQAAEFVELGVNIKKEIPASIQTSSENRL
jgi:DNA recombination protein RmuC